jgi:hypothetical protein
LATRWPPEIIPSSRLFLANVSVAVVVDLFLSAGLTCYSPINNISSLAYNISSRNSSLLTLISIGQYYLRKPFNFKQLKLRLQHNQTYKIILFEEKEIRSWLSFMWLYQPNVFPKF